MDVLNSNVLVLNTTYEPINICNIKRAVILLFKDDAVVLENYDKFIHSPSKKIKAPAVIKLKEYVKIPHKKVVLTRKNILIRDKYTCQYCGKRFPASELTIDHIIPKSKGGLTKWDNVVACCKKCNEKKGHRSPWDANMTLVRKPSAPTYIYFLHIVKHIGSNNKPWQKYLYN